MWRYDVMKAVMVVVLMIVVLDRLTGEDPERYLELPFGPPLLPWESLLGLHAELPEE